MDFDFNTNPENKNDNIPESENKEEEEFQQSDLNNNINIDSMPEINNAQNNFMNMYNMNNEIDEEEQKRINQRQEEANERRKKIEEKINYEINKETDIILCKKEIKNDKYYLNGNMNISLRSDDTKIEINNKEKVLIFSYEDSYNNDDDNLIKKEREKKNPLSDNNIISTDGSWKKI